jgi:hypothetical protein
MTLKQWREHWAGWVNMAMSRRDLTLFTDPYSPLRGSTGALQ